MRTFRSVCICVLLAALTGCGAYTYRVGPKKPLTGAAANFEAVWGAALHVLRSYNFEIDRQERRAGLITTKPLLGQHFFEFWRKDAVTPNDLAESTLHTIYRTVEVQIRPTAKGAITYKPLVQVKVTRSNREDLGIVSATDAYGMFVLPGREEKSRRRLLYGPIGRRDENDKPIPMTRSQLGGYKSLADKLAAEIGRRAVQRPARKKQTQPPKG